MQSPRAIMKGLVRNFSTRSPGIKSARKPLWSTSTMPTAGKPIPCFQRKVSDGLDYPLHPGMNAHVETIHAKDYHFVDKTNGKPLNEVQIETNGMNYPTHPGIEHMHFEDDKTQSVPEFVHQIVANGMEYPLHPSLHTMEHAHEVDYKLDSSRFEHQIVADGQSYPRHPGLNRKPSLDPKQLEKTRAVADWDHTKYPFNKLHPGLGRQPTLMACEANTQAKPVFDRPVSTDGMSFPVHPGLQRQLSSQPPEVKPKISVGGYKYKGGMYGSRRGYTVLAQGLNNNPAPVIEAPPMLRRKSSNYGAYNVKEWNQPRDSSNNPEMSAPVKEAPPMLRKKSSNYGSYNVKEWNQSGDSAKKVTKGAKNLNYHHG